VHRREGGLHTPSGLGRGRRGDAFDAGTGVGGGKNFEAKKAGRAVLETGPRCAKNGQKVSVNKLTHCGNLGPWLVSHAACATALRRRHNSAPKGVTTALGWGWAAGVTGCRGCTAVGFWGRLKRALWDELTNLVGS
jgi:hypothetical protein